ncbi:MAG: glycosyltransferase family 2 protein [Acidobacteriota bacterium]
MKISATLITLNEEENIQAAIESLAFADEIIVVDSESHDRTLEIARRFTDKIFTQKFLGYAAQKNFAADQATHDWIFNLDADERITRELAEAIERLKQSENIPESAFAMPRKVFYLGKWIKHSGWYPDYKIRLYNRQQARWEGDYVHESVKTTGEVKKLTGDILHYTVNSASEHHLRIDRYTTLAAREAFSKNQRATFFSIALSPVVTFVKTYVFKLGFLDGVQGLSIAYFAAQYVFLKKIKLWELQHSKP